MSADAAFAVPTELSFANTVAFVAGITERLGPGALTLDLTPLTRFDSGAVAALVVIEGRARERGVALTLVNAAPNLRKLASLYDVDRLLFGD